jgi:hypothetical protein
MLVLMLPVLCQSQVYYLLALKALRGDAFNNVAL